MYYMPRPIHLFVSGLGGAMTMYLFMTGGDPFSAALFFGLTIVNLGYALLPRD